ncbi:hypothetical protein Q5P01_008016 [Channa striata]|uniref:C2H2-type domain-containing protein n=1 Tax=Channa striata TaxID=64152 RepID=A0AA88SVC9_CHASR|nr:hypothetical protein Q5P01_008016 [Channa striata]
MAAGDPASERQHRAAQRQRSRLWRSFHFGGGVHGHDSPDFVPSVFTCSKPSRSPKKKTKRFYRGRRKRRHKAKVVTEVKTMPPRADSPVDLQSSVLMVTESELKNEIQTPSDPSEPKDREPLPKEAEGMSSPNKTSPSFKELADNPDLDKINPVVLLKPIVSPTGGFQCEVCNQKVSSLSELVKHKQIHKDEDKSFICEICRKCFTSQADFIEHQRDHTDQPSFSCNMCDRSFTTNCNLKRHKLLHVRDGRKCRMCGVLFCRRHNHVVFKPHVEPVSDSEEESSSVEQQNVDSILMSETSLLKECPLKLVPKTNTTPTSATHTGIFSEIPAPKLLETLTLDRPPPPVPIYPRTSGTCSQFKASLPSYPAAVIQPAPPQHLELPGSLKMFSPQFLTSALLEVKRNYEYILSKPGKAKKVIVKEEQCEVPLISPGDHKVKKERTAYDMEITL